MSKYKDTGKVKQNIESFKRRYATMLHNKFYNLYMDTFKFKELDNRQNYYLKKKLWSDGCIAVFKERITGEPILAPFTTASWDYMDFPETIQLINMRGVSFIPSKILTVNEDAVIGYAQYNHKPVSETVMWYIDKLVQIEVITNTNLNIQNMPFIVKCDPADKEKMQDIANRILLGETVIYTDLEAAQLADVLKTEAPYVIDKLNAYKVQVLNDVYTFLGIDNKGDSVKQTTETLDEVNSNNVLINASQEQFVDCLNELSDDAKEYLGITLTLDYKLPKAEETAESRNKSDAENEANADKSDTSDDND